MSAITIEDLAKRALVLRETGFSLAQIAERWRLESTPELLGQEWTAKAVDKLIVLASSQRFGVDVSAYGEPHPWGS